MMWDDHDIFDGWGSYPHALLTCSVFQGDILFSINRLIDLHGIPFVTLGFVMHMAIDDIHAASFKVTTCPLKSRNLWFISESHP